LPNCELTKFPSLNRGGLFIKEFTLRFGSYSLSLSLSLSLFQQSLSLVLTVRVIAVSGQATGSIERKQKTAVDANADVAVSAKNETCNKENAARKEKQIQPPGIERKSKKSFSEACTRQSVIKTHDRLLVLSG